MRAVFNGQEVVNADGAVTALLEPSTSEELTVEVKAHEIVVEDTGTGNDGGNDGDGNGNPDNGNPGDNEPGKGSSQGSSEGSSENPTLRIILITLGSLGIISAIIAAAMHFFNR